MCALLYENFIRNAFGNVERYEDPAGLADADIYNTSNSSTSLNELKIGTGYAIAIYNSNYRNLKKLRDPEDYGKMDQFLAKVIEAKNGNEIIEIIKKYKEFINELEKLPNL